MLHYIMGKEKPRPILAIADDGEQRLGSTAAGAFRP